jgi:predicted nucleic acid-binding protein
MKAVFADTSFFLAMLNPSGVGHEQAVAWSSKSRREVVTTGFVVLELGNALARRGLRRVFVELVQRLRGDPGTTIAPVSQRLFETGLRLFAARADKDWSLTDCSSFAFMQERELKQALSFDRHFRQAGFTMLPDR